MVLTHLLVALKVKISCCTHTQKYISENTIHTTKLKVDLSDGSRILLLNTLSITWIR